MESQESRIFWRVFHSVWGKETESNDYDKKAWMYVQSKVSEHLENKRVNKETQSTHDPR